MSHDWRSSPWQRLHTGMARSATAGTVLTAVAGGERERKREREKKKKVRIKERQYWDRLKRLD